MTTELSADAPITMEPPPRARASATYSRSSSAIRTKAEITKKTAKAENTVSRDSLTTGDLKVKAKKAVMTTAISVPLNRVKRCRGRDT